MAPVLMIQGSAFDAIPAMRQRRELGRSLCGIT